VFVGLAVPVEEDNLASPKQYFVKCLRNKMVNATYVKERSQWMLAQVEILERV
jgi:hypothetical protein